MSDKKEQYLNLENVPNIELNEKKVIHLAIGDKLMNDKSFSWVSHHLESCNSFYNSGISKLFREHNPIQTFHDYQDTIGDYKYKCRLYLGGKNGDKIYYGKPIIYENEGQKYMYPNDARLRNMTYAFTVHYDVDVEYEIYDKELQTKEIIEGETLDRVYFGKFPIMLKSNLCILEKLSTDICYSLGECKEDYGGYFIIDGKEKVIIPQEKFANNMIYSRNIKDNTSNYDYSIEIKSVSEDSSKPQRTLRIMREMSTDKEKDYFVVDIPNVRKPVPFFILMRALGFISDKEIIEAVLLNIPDNEEYLESFITSIHDAGELFTQNDCIRYIGLLTKGKTEYHAHKILCDFLLPHLGEKTYNKKGYFLGHMLLELLKIINGSKEPTDRDHFKYKRVETSGNLMFQLCNEYLNLQYKNIFQKIDKEYYYHEGIYNDNYDRIITMNYNYFFQDRIVEDGFRKAFKGNWGAFTHTKRDGVIQDLNRLSYNSFLSHLRKINLPFDSSAKITGPRLCHGSQYGIIDPIDTPDGGNVGLHKHLTIASKITTHIEPKYILEWLTNKCEIYFLGHVPNMFLHNKTKLFINGNWIGVVDDPLHVKEKFLTARRIGLIPYFISISFIIQENIIEIYSDGGRLIRPAFFTTKEKSKPNDNIYSLKLKTLISYEQTKNMMKRLISDKSSYTWFNCITGFLDKKMNIDPLHNLNYSKLFFDNISDLYNDAEIHQLNKNQGIVEYLDSSETETSLLCSKIESYLNNKNFTHVDIDPSFLLGIMSNQVVFPEHNPYPRDLFGCGQAKQAVSQFHSNFQHRIDKMAVNLNYGQQPILRSKYLKHIQNNKHPHGENAIVAIMCYTSYNVEDAVLINEGSLNRGIFRTTYYNMYETFEEMSQYKTNTVDSKITNVFNENIERTKPGYDYNYLDENGLVQENTKMNDKIVVIGKISYGTANPNEKTDTSIYPKKGQLGYVDKAFISDDEEGRRLAKIRIREERIPAIGDKFCSRCGQKGTIGNIIPERDMPFTKDGIRPDIIINPHAIPSRMTIGQLVECIIGKASINLGAFADGTAFMNLSDKYKPYGEILSKQFGYHSKGNEILYNGMNGEQIESEIFIGPTYYMRLKHMVKDKINYRSKGPRTALTRQTVQGRANDGGLRIGEMERDCIVSHGAASFLKQSMMERGDKYKVAVCNNTGALAIYNPNKDIYLSPQADGPIEFNIMSNDNVQLIQTSVYGRDFSIVEIPYAFKLLMQELMTCNIQMKIITEDNIDQMTNIMYSGRKVNLKDLEEKQKQKQETTKSTIPFFDFSEQEKEIEDVSEEEKEEKEEINTLDDIGELEEVFVSPTIDSTINLNENEIDEDEEQINLPPQLQTKEHLPWKYVESEEETGYISLIIDNTGMPSDIWAELEPEVPDKYPYEWNHSTVSKYNLDEKRIVELLKKNQTRGNWKKVVKQLIDEKQVQLAQNSPLYVPYSPIQHPNSPQYVVPNSNSPYNPLTPTIQPYISNSPPYNPGTQQISNAVNTVGNMVTQGQQQALNTVGTIGNLASQGQQQALNTVGTIGNLASQGQQQAINVVGNLTTQGQQQLNSAIGAVGNLTTQGQQQLSNVGTSLQSGIDELQQQASSELQDVQSKNNTDIQKIVKLN